MCGLCSGEHHFPAIGRIMYITSCSGCETGGFVWISHLSPYLHLMYIDFSILSHPMMSMTSRACDPTLGDAQDLANHICILVATHGNGTPFSPDSFQEEDLVELCMGLGQAHPDGVLWILETEVLLTFQLPPKWQLQCISWVQPQHGMVNLSDSIPILPLTPMSEIMWLQGCMPLQHPNPIPR